ncbi:helix-turn-helix domain-containing protein [Glutamicibacter sp. FBE19]|nr:helix-turn-helix domain-containing protein [Glutamicibacter sp. FBE19]
MLLLADHANEEWMCWPSLELLAMDTCMGERTVRRHLRALEDHGVLECYALYDTRSGSRTGNQFRLVESEMERLAVAGESRRAEMKDRMAKRRTAVRHSKAVGIEAGIDTDTKPPANMADGSSPVNSSPAKLADGENSVLDQGYIAVNSSPAKLADGEEPPANLAKGLANLAKNTEVPLKERARINHHHQSSDARPAEPIATPVNDDDDSTTNDQQLKVSAPPAESYMGVDLGALHHMVPEQLKSLNVAQVRSVIDIVLSRASSKVSSPLRYVAAACRTEPEALYAAVTGLSAVTGPVATVGGFSQEVAGAGHEAGVIAECDRHEWSSPNPNAICPGCNANFLSGESHENPRPGKPQPGWFRTNILVSEQEPAGETGDVQLPWGPHDEPGF